MKKKSKNICDCKPRVIFILAIVFVLFLIALTISTIVDVQNKIKQGKYIGQDVEIKNTITVSGTGEVYSKPDLGLITFSVRNESETVSLAMAENTANMNAIISIMKSKGIEDKDLKTTSFNVYPRYEWKKSQIEIWPQPERERVLVGYEINQSLQVKIRDLNKIGEIIQGATDAGASQVGNLQFTIDNQDELKKQAREDAIKEAKGKAKELANQLGVRLVKITGFSEGGTVPRYYDYSLKEMAVSSESSTPQIETGENKIEISVNIIFEIN